MQRISLFASMLVLVAVGTAQGQGSTDVFPEKSLPPSPRWVVIKHETLVITSAQKKPGETPLARHPYDGPLMKLAQVEEPSSQPDPFADGTVEDDPFANGTPEGETPFEEDPFAKDEEDIPPISDPWEGFNRSMQWFNDQMYDYLLRPVATTYRDVVYEELRIAIRNLFDNAAAPVKLVGSLAQGDLNKSGRVISRTLINTAFGWGGMLDVAGQEYGIENVNEDFGQAMGVWGIGSGPYMVLPFLGPSSVRHTVGRVVDSILNPTFFFSPGFVISAGITAGQMVNEISFRVDDIETFRKDAIDPYHSLRDFYHQFRVLEIRK